MVMVRRLVRCLFLYVLLDANTQRQVISQTKNVLTRARCVQQSALMMMLRASHGRAIGSLQRIGYRDGIE